MGFLFSFSNLIFKMNKIIISAFICLLSIFSNAQTVNQNSFLKEAPLFSETKLLQNIKTLSSDAFEGRRTGTKGAIKAKAYIINQFHFFNVLPLGKKFEQSFSFSTNGKSYNAGNVLGFRATMQEMF